MFNPKNADWLAWVAVIVYLLQTSTEDLKLCQWLSPLKLGWIIAALSFVYPFVQKGSKIALGAGYVLMGALVFNTLILGFLSVLPNQVVSFKSEGVQTMGMIFVVFLGTGLFVLLKTGVLFAWKRVKTWVKPRQSLVLALGNA